MSRAVDSACPVLVLKASRDAVNHGSVAVARTLGGVGAPIYAVVANRCTPLAACRYVKDAFLWKQWPDDSRSFVAAMAAAGESVGRRSVLIAVDDLSAIYAAENAAELAQWFVLPRVKPDVPRQMADKIHFHARCLEIGMPIARTIAPNSIDDVLAVAENWKFPVVVKAAEQWALLYDRFNAKVVSSPRELIALYNGLEKVEEPRSIIQEYIRGEDWIAHGYYNSESGLRLTFTGRKLLGYPPMAGSTSVGLSMENEALRCQTESLVGDLGYSGIVDIDWRLDELDGQYKVIDCNPRIGQNFRMFENIRGIDVARAQYFDLTGRDIERAPMVVGRTFRVESFGFLAFLRGSYRRVSTGRYRYVVRSDANRAGVVERR